MPVSVLSFPRRIPITRDGQLGSDDFLRFIEAAINRLGGPIAPTISELDMQQFADAGIEEGKALVASFADQAASGPLQDTAPLLRAIEDAQTQPPGVTEQINALTTEVHELREIVHTLITEIQALKGSPL